MVRVKQTPRRKKVNQVALLSATPTTGGRDLDAALQQFVDDAPAMQAAVNKRNGVKRKKRRGKHSNQSPEFVITRGEEELIEEAARLQHNAPKRRGRIGKRKSKTKSLSRADAKLIDQAARLQDKYKRSLKRHLFTKRRPKPVLDKRTTLLSLLRRIPDAKKPLTTWLK